jgi:hydrogenase maturation factor
MISLTEIGKEQLKNTYPNVGCKLTIQRLFFDFVKIYTNCNVAMYIFYKDVHYYYFNVITMTLLIPIVYIVLNTIITLLTTYERNESDISFHALINRGRFKLGVFQFGSIIRHVVMDPVIDTVFGLSVIVLTGVSMSNIDVQLTSKIAIILYAAELFYGFLYVLVLRDENIFSFTPVIEFLCFRKITSVGVINDTKETEEDNDDIEEEVHEQEGPFYRSFSV